MGLLVEYRILDNLKVINEGTKENPKIKLKGRFQRCDEQNKNGRLYPRKILESQVNALQDKISERSLVGALDHPANTEILLSQASHVITGLKVEKNGDVIGECEILSTPSGKIVQALINDGVKIGISSRGVGTLSEAESGAKVVNDDFKLITFDLVSDPSTKGAYPELTESAKNSEKAQRVLSRMKSQKVFMTMLEEAIDSRRGSKEKKDTWNPTVEVIIEGAVKKANKAKKKEWERTDTDGFDDDRTGKTVHHDPDTAQKLSRKDRKKAISPEQKADIFKKERLNKVKRLKTKIKENIELDPFEQYLAEAVDLIESVKGSKAKRAIKSYLISHINDITYSWPFDADDKPVDISKKIDYDQERLDKIAAIVAAIQEL